MLHGDGPRREPTLCLRPLPVALPGETGPLDGRALVLASGRAIDPICAGSPRLHRRPIVSDPGVTVSGSTPARTRPSMAAWKSSGDGATFRKSVHSGSRDLPGCVHCHVPADCLPLRVRVARVATRLGGAARRAGRGSTASGRACGRVRTARQFEQDHFFVVRPASPAGHERRPGRIRMMLPTSDLHGLQRLGRRQPLHAGIAGDGDGPAVLRPS